LRRCSLIPQNLTSCVKFVGIDQEKIERDTEGRISEEKRKELYKDIIFFPSIVFGKICQLALDNEKVSRSLLVLVLNSGSTLEIKIPLQYVCIEALTGAIIKKGNSELKPIDDDRVAGELAQILKNETELFLKGKGIRIDSESIAPLFKRLDTLNAPTNVDKLSKPFNEVGYIISGEEKKLIKLRDTFLHGSIKTFGEPEDDFKGLFYISLKLQFLISVLLLKKSGFQGRIINYAKLYEHITERYSDEDVFFKI